MTEPISKKLQRKIATNKNKLPKDREDLIVKEYLQPGASYRSVSDKTGHAVGTVMRAIQRRKTAEAQ